MNNFAKLILASILFIIIFILYCYNAISAECEQFDGVVVGNNYVVTCQTDDKNVADKNLSEQKSEDCFVAKEHDEEIYRVFCPYTNAISN